MVVEAFFAVVVFSEVSGMAEQTRPKRVIIVDAEDPMREIRGEFFWREDHERILAAERQEAFNRGYAEGLVVGQRQTPAQVVYWRRGMTLRRTAFRLFALFLIAAFLVGLVQSFHMS